MYRLLFLSHLGMRLDFMVLLVTSSGVFLLFE